VAKLKIHGISTSIIGSFTIEDSEANRKRCTDDLAALGLDYPSYPQLSEMGPQFLDDLVKHGSGVQREKNRYRLVDKKVEYDGPPLGLESFFWTTKYLDEKGLTSSVKLKAPITGPFTLASYVETKLGMFPYNTAASDLNIVNQFAEILSESCRAASESASIISVDEPILSVLVGAKAAFGYRDEDVIGVYDSLVEACGGKIVGTHICGRISPKLADILLGTKLDFLSHEFFDSPKNVALYSPEKLRKNGKVLSVGCLSTKNPRVESQREILNLMNQFNGHREAVIFTPDCGFRKLLGNNRGTEEAYRISLAKLRNMVAAAEEFKASG
jgi:5-methyltetrahydropteroyltriglutamate--homocysteine methyltransferase